MNLYRAFAEVLPSPLSRKWLLHPIIVLRPSFYSITSVEKQYAPHPKPERSNISHVDHSGIPTSEKIRHKRVSDWPKPTEIPYQAKVANSVNLIGSIRMPVQFQDSPDGKYWASTVIAQEKTLGFPSLCIPIIFEGDLAHTAACHLKENDLVHIGGQLRADPTPFAMEHGQANMQVMVHSINFVGESWKRKKSYAWEDAQAFSNSASIIKDRQSGDCSWRDLVDNPKEWWDHRKRKLDGLVKPRHPDFKHKVSGQSLWLDDAPKWFLSELGHLEFDVQINKSEQQKGDNDGESWKDLVENPDRWWDNRSKKLNERSPDFKHKDTGKALWLTRSPDWVLSKLPPS